MKQFLILATMGLLLGSCWEFRVIEPKNGENKEFVRTDEQLSDLLLDKSSNQDIAFEVGLRDQGRLDIDLCEVDEAESVDARECPPGHIYNRETESCLSFCEADEYFEKKQQKCLKYPCCDLAGHWELKLLDNESMDFEVYQIELQQTVSYLSCKLNVGSGAPADCQGSLEDDHFSLTCDYSEWNLTLDGLAQENKVNGMYVLDKKDGSEVEGPFNLK